MLLYIAGIDDNHAFVEPGPFEGSWLFKLGSDQGDRRLPPLHICPYLETPSDVVAARKPCICVKGRCDGCICGKAGLVCMPSCHKGVSHLACVRPSPPVPAPPSAGLVCGCVPRSVPGLSLAQWAHNRSRDSMRTRLPWGSASEALYFRGRAKHALYLWRDCRGLGGVNAAIRKRGLFRRILHTFVEYSFAKRLKRRPTAVVYQRRMVAAVQPPANAVVRRFGPGGFLLWGPHLWKASAAVAYCCAKSARTAAAAAAAAAADASAALSLFEATVVQQRVS